MKLYIGNAFSLSMLNRDVQSGHGSDPLFPPRIPRPVTDDVALAIIDAYQRIGTIESCIGHPDTATLFSTLLGIELPVNRISVKLDDTRRVSLDDPPRLLVGQYTGPRLPEGCTTLPDGASIEWWIV